MARAVAHFHHIQQRGGALCARTPRTPLYIMGSATFFSALVRGTRLNVWNTNPIFRQRMRESCLSRSVPTSTPSST
jgi:hypothetical protein